MSVESPVLHPSVAGQAGTAHVRWRLILVLAVVARIVAVVVSFHFSRVPPLTDWGFENIAIALSLHAGHGFSSPFFSQSGPTAFMAPGYPLVLAAVMSVLGTGSVAATAVVVLQELFSLITVVLVLHIARLHFGESTANFAGLLCALMPPMLIAPVQIWDTSLSALLLAGIFAAASTPYLARLRFVPAGAACAIAGLINPALIPTLSAICGWSAWKAKRIPWAGIAAFLIVFSPWPIRNAVVMHAFIPLRTDFGYEFWMGNHTGGDGNFVEAMNPMMSARERQDFVRRGEIAYLHEKGALARSFIAAHPGKFLELSLKRAWQFWAGMEGSSNSMTLPLTLLAFAGLAMAWRRRALAILYLLPLLIFPLPYYITHVLVRFQYVIDPMLVVLAGYALAALLGSSKRRDTAHTERPARPAV
jgi:hypothetical protein